MVVFNQLEIVGLSVYQTEQLASNFIPCKANGYDLSEYLFVANMLAAEEIVAHVFSFALAVERRNRFIRHKPVKAC